jgi:hypothetical protein
MCTVLLPPGVKPIAVKYIISYHTIIVSSSVSDGGSRKNLMLFTRGDAMSGPPSTSGTSQFPKPPIMIAITIKIKS